MAEQAEEWTPIPGYKLYQISKNGEIRRINKDDYEQLQPKENSGSYSIYLTNDEKGRNNFTVQKYMAITFLGLNKNDKKDIEHINGNRLDNRLENLRLADPKPERVVANPRGTGTNTKKIWRINPTTNEKLQLHDSIRDAIRWVIDNVEGNAFNCTIESYINTNTKHIKNAIINNLTHLNFKWEFENINGPLEGEEWRDIPPVLINHNHKFQVSNFGRIRGEAKNITTGWENTDGTLSTRTGDYQPIIFKIVAAVFLENPDKKHDIKFKDGNKLNCRADNLEYI